MKEAIIYVISDHQRSSELREVHLMKEAIMSHQ